MTQKLNIDIVARDKSKQALNGVQKGLARLKQSVFNLQNAFIGLGAGLVIRNFVNTGKQLESLNVRLKFLFGSANEGAKAFNNMAKFASKVPFSLEEIQQGAGVLSVVSKDANELSHILEITGNVASVTGLDFRTTAEQIQRSLSAGISSADLFRERGVKAMLGFSAGATVSVEQTVEAFERVFGKGGRFGKATDELAKTFEGTLSMIGDKVFNFKKVLLEAGLFESLKKEFGALDKFLEQNSKSIDRVATNIGIALGFAVKKVANFVIILKNNMDKFLTVIKLLIAVKVVKLFLSLGSAIQFASKQMAKFSVASLMSVKGLKSLVVLLAKGGALYGAFKGIDKLFEETAKSFDDFSHSVKNVLPPARDLHKTMIRTKKEVKEIVQLSARELGLIKNQNQQMDTFKDKLRNINETALKNLQNKFKDIETIIAQGIIDGVKKISRSIAESIILGKDLVETFRALAQQVLVNIVAHLIEEIALLGIKKILKQDEINANKYIESSLKRQIGYQSTLVAMNQLGLNTGGGMGGAGGKGQFGSTIGGAIGTSMGGPIGGAVGSFLGSFLPFAKGGAVSKGNPILVGEQGPELFVPNQTGQITQSARGTNDGATTVNFNINTVDASGFEDLLFRSRGTISALINQAVNEQGRGAVI